MTLSHTGSVLARAALVLGAFAVSPFALGCSGADASTDDADEAALSGHQPAVAITEGTLAYREIATHDGFAYWTEGGRVLAAPVTGGDPTVIYQGKTSESVDALVVDDDSVYFNQGGDVLRVALTGGKAELVTHLRYDLPVWIAEDADYVYWTGMNENHADYSVYIRRVKKTGGSIETVYTGYKGGEEIAVDEDYVYFYGMDFDPAIITMGPDYILRVKKDGSAAPEQLAELPDTHIRALTMDATNIYFSSAHGEWDISSMPKSGGTPTVLRHVSLAPTNEPHLLVATEASLYWTTPGTFNQSSSGDHNATLHRMAKTGGRAQILVDGIDVPDRMAYSTGSCPVWASHYGVFTVSQCP